MPDSTTLALWVTTVAAAVGALATVVLVIFNAVHIRKLDQAHERSIQPHIQWESPYRAVVQPGAGIVDFSVNARNVGPGSARVTQARVRTSLGEDLTITGLTVPSTLPSGQQYDFHINYHNFVAALVASAQAPVELEIVFDYTDVERRLCYRSRIVLNLAQNLGGAGAGPIDFLVADERPASQRRVTCD